MVVRNRVWLICSVAFLQGILTWIGQLKFHYLLGTDAYYLLVQAQSVFAKGSLKMPDHDVVPYLIAALMRAGIAGESSVQVVLAVIHGLLTGLLIAMVLPIKRLSLFFGAISSLLVVESVGLYHIFEFPKLSLALTAFFAALLCLQYERLGRFLGLIFALLAVLIHPAVLPVAIIYFVFLLFHEGEFRRYPRTSVGAVAVSILISCGYFLSRQGNEVLERVSESTGGPGIFIFLTRTNLSRLLQGEVIAILVLLSLAIGINLWKKRFFLASVLTSLFLLVFLPTSKSEMFGLGERLVLIVAVVSVPFLIQTLKENVDEFSFSSLPMKATIVFLAVLLGLSWQQYLFRDALPTADYIQLEKIVSVVSARNPDMLIAYRSLKFYYTAMTGRDAFIFDPDADWDQKKVWRVVLDVDVDEILHFAPTYCVLDASLVSQITNTQSIYVREDCWQGFREQISQDQLPGLWDRVWANDRNPSRGRPKFLKDRYTKL